MRQLTSLDAQFLAVESARTYGHVGGLAVYDPDTAPGGRLEMADICRLVSERIHMLPPFRWRLVEVPLGLDHPYWVEDPDFDLDFHIRDSAVPPPGDDLQLSETVARETGAKTAVLNPIEGLTRDERRRGEDYFSLMRRNLAVLRAGLQCR